MMVTEKKVSHTLAAIPLQSQQCTRAIVSLRSCPSRVLSLRAHAANRAPATRTSSGESGFREARTAEKSVPGIVRVF